MMKPIGQSPILAGLILAGLGGCASVAPISPAQPQEAVTATCSTAVAAIDSDFPTGNIANCRTSGDSRFTLTFSPEDAPPINCSAWYAFRVNPAKSGRVTVDLDYSACGHRYWPKVSTDRVTWTNLPQSAVKISGEGENRRASLSLSVGDEPLFVAGQEILPPAAYDAWLDRVTVSAAASRWLLGKSAEGRDIPAMTIAAPDVAPRETVVLIGRQHPPEVTGALAMLPFVETLLGDSDLARRYRARFETIVVPILNPDGVVHGNFRHNTGGTDLNRDWGPFAQPETKLMEILLKDIAADPDRQLRVFMDFHSTQRDVFYTIPDENPTKPEFFIRNWLARLQERMPDYAVNRDENHNADAAVSKAYVYEQYGVPTVTFEIGDETDRALIRKIGTEAAIAMMETLLASD